MNDGTRAGVRLLTSASVNRHDPAALNLVDSFVSGQRPALTALQNSLPGAVRARVAPALALLDDVSRRTGGLRATLRCDNLSDARTDDLGPLPNRCAAQQPTGSHPGGTTGTAGTSGPAGTGGAVPAGRSTGVPTSPGAPAETGNPGTPTDKPTHDDGGLLGELGHLLGGLFD